MKTDLLHGTRCPGCGILANHPEAKISRIRADEIVSQTLDGEFVRCLRCWYICAICERVFIIIARADFLDNTTTLAWLYNNPIDLLPPDAPR